MKRVLVSRIQSTRDWVDQVAQPTLVLRKGFAYPEGTRRRHGGREVIKRAGKWVPVPRGQERLGQKTRGLELPKQYDPAPPVGKTISEEATRKATKEKRQKTRDLEQLFAEARRANQELIELTKDWSRKYRGRTGFAPSMFTGFQTEEAFSQAMAHAKAMGAEVVLVNKGAREFGIFDVDKGDKVSAALKRRGIDHDNSRGVKSEKRAAEKASTKYADPDGTPNAEKLTDLVRSSVKFDRISDIYQALEGIVRNPDIEIVDFDDRFRDPAPGGYRDISLNLRLSNGHIAEVQLHVEKIFDAKMGPGHALYEQSRKIEAEVDKRVIAGTPPPHFTPQEAREVARLFAEQERMYGQAYQSAL